MLAVAGEVISLRHSFSEKTCWLPRQRCPLHLSHLRGAGRARAQMGAVPRNTPLKDNSERSQPDLPSGSKSFAMPHPKGLCHSVLAHPGSNLQWGWALAGKGCPGYGSSRKGPALCPDLQGDKCCTLGCSDAGLGWMSSHRWGGSWKPLHKGLPHWA